ncbi:Cytoplasmic glyoxalase II [Dimargaris verticillata]|uniref:hydroxyacylglutathione hydrolase n=1 Tax=Dimargaris verticillata TaxID=2761393 RepID=A0A9W8EBQ2_9FUNG|nr:Cytoplasmic glyoxalase II [Dimargaris verticillata]
MHVVPVPALKDNYSYLIIDDKKNEAALVDPVEPGKILPLVSQGGFKLTALLTTHHHWDHSGGNIEVVSKHPGLLVYGADARIPEINYVIKDGEQFQIGSLTVTPFMTIGHTKGSVSFYVTDGDQKALFTGDTMFIGGCGRFFEGTGEDMYHSLIEVIGSLPSDTLIYCGHEYTLQNLKFANTVDPNNPALHQKWAQCQQQPINVPSILGEEKQYNPFMRVNEPALKAATKKDNPVEVMQELRNLKDNFQ